MWIIHGMGEQKFVQMVQVTWPRWPPCPYMVKHYKIFSGTKRPMTLKVDIQHRVREYCQICSNDAPGLTLIYFTARSNLVPYAFVWEKFKTIDFSETIVVYDIKVGRCSQLNEYMKLYEYQRSRSCIDLGPNHSESIFLAHLSLLACWWAYSIAMVRRPSVVHHIQRSPKPLGLSKPNFIWSLSGIGERKFILGV